MTMVNLTKKTATTPKVTPNCTRPPHFPPHCGCPA